MNLAIDIGNTSISVGLFKTNILKDFHKKIPKSKIEN